MSQLPKAVALDIIETTFSLEAVRAALVQLGFPGNSLEVWFARTLRDAFALATTDSFAPFGALFDSNLEELARSHSIALAKQQKERVLEQFAALAAHPDAAQALQMLRDASIPVFALTNGAAANTEKLLDRADLKGFVAGVISVDEIRQFKPRREIYHHAAGIAGVLPSELALMAAHAWDIHGAKQAGLLAGFVARGQRYPSAMTPPDVLGTSLIEVARGLLRLG